LPFFPFLPFPLHGRSRSFLEKFLSNYLNSIFQANLIFLALAPSNPSTETSILDRKQTVLEVHFVTWFVKEPESDVDLSVPVLRGESASYPRTLSRRSADNVRP